MTSDNFSRRRALTYVACAVIIALAVPAGAFATVVGTNMFLTDPTTGHRAHVNSAGQVLANVTGTVATIPIGTPFTQYCSGYASPSSDTAQCTFTPAIPAGKWFVVQQVTALGQAASGDTIPRSGIYGPVPGRSTLNYFFLPLTPTGVSGSYANFEALETTNFVLTSAPADGAYMTGSHADGPPSWQVTMTGYLR